MLVQKLRNRQPTALQGLGLVLLIALAAAAGSAFFTLMQRRIGVLASVLFIAYGCVIAWFLLNWYALSYVYTATADCLRVCRAYGKRERFAADIWLNRVVAWGEPDAMKQRYPTPGRFTPPGPSVPTRRWRWSIGTATASPSP